MYFQEDIPYPNVGSQAAVRPLWRNTSGFAKVWRGPHPVSNVGGRGSVTEVPADFPPNLNKSVEFMSEWLHTV